VKSEEWRVKSGEWPHHPSLIPHNYSSDEKIENREKRKE